MYKKKYIQTKTLKKDELLYAKFSQVKHLNILVNGWMKREYYDEHYSPAMLPAGAMVGLVPAKAFPVAFQS